MRRNASTVSDEVRSVADPIALFTFAAAVAISLAMADTAEACEDGSSATAFCIAEVTMLLDVRSTVPAPATASAIAAAAMFAASASETPASCIAAERLRTITEIC